MAFFKMRKGGADAPSTPSPHESVEVMRRRAKHRLIGAAVLVLIGVVGFPLLFDTQPRPIAVDIPIEIPDRNKAAPPALPAAPAPQAAVEQKAPAAHLPVAASANKSEAAIEPKPEPSSRVGTAAGDAGDGVKAKALLEGNAANPAATPAAVEPRFVVQVGAFADASKAQETRLKVEKAGLKTYTHVAETKDGRRTRVRVGPFATRADADKAADRVKGLNLPATILAL